MSVTPQPGHPGYEAFERALRQYFDSYAQAGILTMPTICWITAGRFRSQERLQAALLDPLRE